MLRRIGGAIAGVVAWVVLVIAIDFVMRRAWPDYAAVEKTLAFTLPMMIARLSMSGVSSFASGAVAAYVGRDRFMPALIAGVLLLVVFIPVHVSIWSKFPVWYHLTFLVSLPVLSLAGGRLVR